MSNPRQHTNQATVFVWLSGERIRGIRKLQELCVLGSCISLSKKHVEKGVGCEWRKPIWNQNLILPCIFVLMWISRTFFHQADQIGYLFMHHIFKALESPSKAIVTKVAKKEPALFLPNWTIIEEYSYQILWLLLLGEVFCRYLPFFLNSGCLILPSIKSGRPSYDELLSTSLIASGSLTV